MQSYFAVVFTDLVRHSLIWDKVPRNAMTTIIAEYRYLAQSIASQYGRRHENFTGDGHLFLFESADVAAHFGLKLIAYWKQRRRSLLAVHKAPDLPIRVGCHFGECSQLADADDWVGRAINVAKRVEAVAEADAFFITQTILELLDLPFYEFSEAGFHDLKGDFLPRRQLYRLVSVDQSAMAERRPEEMSAEDWFLKGVGMADRTRVALCARRSARGAPRLRGCGDGSRRDRYAGAHRGLQAAERLKRPGPGCASHRAHANPSTRRPGQRRPSHGHRALP
jgi:class 3 adenylate cyclase